MASRVSRNPVPVRSPVRSAPELKCPVVPGEDDRPHLGIGLDPVQRVAQGGLDRAGQHPGRPSVEGQHRDVRAVEPQPDAGRDAGGGHRAGTSRRAGPW
ncbi:hypothetical protein [Pseudonocardia autotrophica]|uniref:hypothetical protein n=1 Tax=Pseudonocardia autotrophica TaxID=2074 RepID=UPI000A28C3C9|nr:hypothetical protein [Pseudonocardia autotrophica]